MSKPRRNPRHQMPRNDLKRIAAAFSTHELQGKGQISKLSRKGLFFATERLPLPGHPVCVVFRDRSGNKISVEGTVRWNTAQMRPYASGFGMQIEEASSEYLEFYENILVG